jgi:hypothetical protein
LAFYQLLSPLSALIALLPFKLLRCFRVDSIALFRLLSLLRALVRGHNISRSE